MANCIDGGQVEAEQMRQTRQWIAITDLTRQEQLARAILSTADAADQLAKLARAMREHGEIEGGSETAQYIEDLIRGQFRSLLGRDPLP